MHIKNKEIKVGKKKRKIREKFKRKSEREQKWKMNESKEKVRIFYQCKRNFRERRQCSMLLFIELMKP